MTDKNEIIRICNKTSFSVEDLNTMRNLYLKYINNKASICLSCPDNLRHYVKVFQENKDHMLKNFN